MPFFMAVRGIHEHEQGVSVPGPQGNRILRETAFEDPDAVDGFSRTPGSIAMVCGYRVRADTVPARLIWSGGRLALPEILVLARVAIVCDRFRDLVERFEPGRHQFIPVGIQRGKTGPVIAEYNWFNICTRLDSVDPDRTTWVRIPTSHGDQLYVREIYEDGRWTQVPDARLVFSTARIADHHVWVDHGVNGAGYAYLSNALAAAALAEGFTGLSLTPREEA